MTNKEAAINAVQMTGYSDGAIEKALIDAGITGSDTYVVAGMKDVDLVAIEVLKGMLGVESISEGGFRIGYSIEGVKARLRYFSDKYGIVIEGLNPTIRKASFW